MSRTIAAAARELLEREPEREAWSFTDLASGAEERLTRAALWSRAEAVAAALGPSVGQRVLLVLELGPGLVAAHLGCLLAGAVPSIHAHPSSKVSQEVYARNLAHVVELLRPAAVVASRRFVPALAGTSRVIVAEELPAAGEGATAWKEVPPDSPALVQHSSGSTGLQKGVVLTHRMVLEQCRSYGGVLGLDAGRDRVCSWLPLYHDMGLFTAWLLPLLAGVPVSALDPFAWAGDPGSILRLLTTSGGTLCWQPNFAYSHLAARVKDDELPAIELSRVRGFVSCAEPVRAASHRDFLTRFAARGLRAGQLWTCYAMAENGFAVTAATDASVLACDAVALSKGRVEPAGKGPAAELVSCGVPIPGCEVRVVDPATRAPLPERSVGEIALRSPSTLREYLDNPAATAAALDREGWFHSGDLGFLADGALHVTGRAKDLLIVAGRNFYPQDLEAIADGCPHAIPGRAVALGVADEETGTERVVLLVESHASDAAAKAELAAALRQRVHEQLDCPVAEVHVVPHMWLLKTTSGKVARRPNLERYLALLAPGAVPLPSWGESIAWAAAIAAAVYLTIALLPNASWGVYAGF